MAVLLAPERAVAGALILCLAAPSSPALWRFDGVRALTLRDGVSATASACSRGCPAVLWPSARLCWEMALRRRDETSKLALKIRSPKSPRPSARRDARGRVARALAACKTLAKMSKPGSTAKKARFRHASRRANMSLVSLDSPG